jgi:sugar (pentulose or hexulose) kinase
VSSLAAQSHLWVAPDATYAPIVAAQGWAGLMPPLRPAWATLGTLLPGLARRTGLGPDTRILCGVHDSTANVYRYQAAGWRDFTVVSTGTWIVALSDAADPESLDEARGMTCNADVTGRPLGGAIVMGGREFSHVAGDPCDPGPTPSALVAGLVGRGTMALPSFGHDDNLFPGRAGRGAIAGPPPADPPERRALAILYTALLTDACLTALGSGGDVILDGSFTADPLYADLVAALRPDLRVHVSREAAGPAAGAALLATHETRPGPVAAPLATPRGLDIPGLAAYRARWLTLCTEMPG